MPRTLSGFRAATIRCFPAYFFRGSTLIRRKETSPHLVGEVNLMGLPRLLAVGLLIISLVGCGDDPVSSGDPGYPDKLYPYETFFDLPTAQVRRDRLVGALPEASLVILATNETSHRTGDVNYAFRPASTLYYLTGFDEPSAIALIRESDSHSGSADLTLFVNERTPGEVKWLGPSYGVDGAVNLFGADRAYPVEEFGARLAESLSSGSYSALFWNPGTNAVVESLVSELVGGSVPLMDVTGIVDSMRVVKSANEIQAIRRAVDVSMQAFQEAMRRIEPGMYEYEVEAIFDFVTRVNGSPSPAFPTIVASGPNINVLHYDANRRRMEDGDLVMIDFGAEYGYYASDVTRTLPVGGTFTAEQAALHDLVLDVHRAVLEAAAPGVNYYDLYVMARAMAIDGLLARGIISGNRDEIISSGRYRQYVVAGLGHGVGLDVHDPFPDDPPGVRTLREGVVMAFEPHVYLDPNDTSVAAAYRGLAARIEDTVLITATGVEILSGALPWETSDLERAMR